MKKIVQGFTKRILPSPSNLSVSNLHARFAHEALCALLALFCCFQDHSVIFLRSTAAVETPTA